ncbi:MAG: AmmeMemoRadiSam system protein B, partial [Planctomycetota bacterium]
MRLKVLYFSLALAAATALVTGGVGCGQKSGTSELDQAPGGPPAVAKPTGTGTPDAKPEDSPRPADVPGRPPAARVAGPVREPAAAGGFYPADANELRKMVAGYLAAAKKVQVPGRVIAIIAPHAGYSFSGPAAGWAYKQIEGADVETVILVGGHSGGLPAAAVWPGGSWETPLGAAAVDGRLAAALCRASGKEPAAARGNTKVHLAPLMGGRPDQALEVQVPFVQVALPRAKIVPVYYNTQDAAAAARLGTALARAMSGRKAVMVASTDLSHYPDAATATKVDRAILQTICTLDSRKILEVNRRLLAAHQGKNLSCVVCGMGAVLATVEAAKKLGATGARVIGYDHSGNRMRRDKSRVVGYAAVAIYGPPAVRPAGRMLSGQERKMLLSLARKSVGLAFEKKKFPPLQGLTPALRTKAGAFVTLTTGGRLRGCIGTFSRKTEL